MKIGKWRQIHRSYFVGGMFNLKFAPSHPSLVAPSDFCLLFLQECYLPYGHLHTVNNPDNKDSF